MAQSGVNDLHEDLGACGGARLFRNVFEMLLDGLFCQSHFLSNFPILVQPFKRCWTTVVSRAVN